MDITYVNYLHCTRNVHYMMVEIRRESTTDIFHI